MVGRRNPFTRNYFVGDISKTRFLEDFISEARVESKVESIEHLYPVPFKLVNHLRRHTRSYVKNIGRLKPILELLRRRTPRSIPTYTEDSILVRNLE